MNNTLFNDCTLLIIILISFLIYFQLTAGLFRNNFESIKSKSVNYDGPTILSVVNLKELYDYVVYLGIYVSFVLFFIVLFQNLVLPFLRSLGIMENGEIEFGEKSKICKSIFFLPAFRGCTVYMYSITLSTFW